MSEFERKSPTPFESESEEARIANERRRKEALALKLIEAEHPGHKAEFIMPDTSDGALLFGEFGERAEGGSEGEVQHPRTLYRVMLPRRTTEKGTVQVLDIIENEAESGEGDNDGFGVLESKAV